MYDTNRRLTSCRLNRGSSLLISLVVLLAFALLVLAGSHYLLGEQRISANQNDRQFAFQLAELALRDAEQEIDLLDRTLIVKDQTEGQLFTDTTPLFTSDCSTDQATARWGKKGLCLTADRTTNQPVAWERSVTTTNGEVPLLSPCGNARGYVYETDAGQCNDKGKITAGSRVWSNPRYIVELIGQNSMKDSRSGRLYRVTARAWGRNQNTQVTVQSFFFIPLPIDKSYADGTES